MFVHAEQELNVGFTDATAGLAAVSSDGWLKRASADAYDAGLGDLAGQPDTAESSGLARVGPRGEIPLISKVVRVYVTDVRTHRGSAVLALRWEATGLSGDLFPALDADITVTPVGEATSLITLDGAYRPPLGALGVALDNMILHRIATATARALLTRIAESIAERAS